MKVYVINGPNLNMLGKREVGHYGSGTLADLEVLLRERAVGQELVFFQSNSEGDLISYIQALPPASKVIINAGAYTHTSIALRDALLAVQADFIEVHISNVYKRETFRHHSYLSDIARGVIAGLGFQSYALALRYFLEEQGE